MTLAILLCLALSSACVLTHYEILRLVNDFLASTRLIAERPKVLAALSGAMVSHLAQIALFGLSYYWLRDNGLGGFGGTFEDSMASFMYFSIETYTTLGFGDIYPVGPLRLICGIESLLGLLMISWTASFTYLEMRRHW